MVTPRLLLARLAPLRTPSSIPQNQGGNANTTLGNTMQPLTMPMRTQSEGDVTMKNIPARNMGSIAASVRTLVQRTPHDANRNGRNATRNPLDNYTNATMPKVHDAFPTSPFQYIDLNLISEWELLEGGKLLIIPFGEAAHDPKLHDVIKNRILYAVAEITQSQGIGVSAPTPSTDADEEDRYPSSFLTYNLTIPQRKLLLDRGVWSSQAITFRAVPFHPTNPDYLFTIRGFSLNIEDHIKALVYNVWHDADTASFVHNTINAAPENDHTMLNYAIISFLDSLTVACLNIKERGGGLTPRFNIYASGAMIPLHSTWLDIRQYLADRIYYTSLTGQGEVVTNPYSCGTCHGVDHPKGMCPFHSIKGWNGPGRNPRPKSRYGRNGGQPSHQRYGTGIDLNRPTRCN